MANIAASPPQPVVIEISVVSAQGLRNAASFPIFWKRLKPYATVTPLTEPPCLGPLLRSRMIEEADERHPALYTTRVDDRGGTYPRWNEKFRIPMESSFFAGARSSICVRVYSRGFSRRGSQLGWCRIPAKDILKSSSPQGRVGYLSYRLRDPRDGTRGGIVNLAVKLEGLLENPGSSSFVDGLLENAGSSSFVVPHATSFVVPHATRTVIGIPVSLPLSTGKFSQYPWFDMQSHY